MKYSAKQFFRKMNQKKVFKIEGWKNGQGRWEKKRQCRENGKIHGGNIYLKGRAKKKEVSKCKISSKERN